VKMVADDGTILDATFRVLDGPALSIRYEQAGGAAGRARNRDYTPGLVLLLRRLQEIDAVIVSAEVETSVTAVLPPEERRLRLRRYSLPLRLRSVEDIPYLKSDFTTAARAPGARPGSALGGSSRTLRIELAPLGLSVVELEQRLAGRGASDDVKAVSEVVDAAAGRRISGQGFVISTVVKVAVEMHAMRRARELLEEAGWEVEDVSRREPCDLECRRGEAAVLHVEVKGTTTAGGVVLVTPNEIAHALAHHPHTLLFIVHDIDVDGEETEAPVASNGEVRRVDGWAQHTDRLRAVGYEYTVEDDAVLALS
jgi:uncharacterized protein DUF3883